MRDGPSRPFNVSTYFYDAEIAFFSRFIGTGDDSVLDCTKVHAQVAVT